MKKLVILLTIAFSTFGFSQSLDDYKYALVPAKFSIFRNNDFNRLNILTKMYLQKYGFETYLDSEEFPTDFANSNCNKVYVDLIENNTLFLTKVKVVIKDCNGKVVATSEEGKSREKDLNLAYNEALRSAFNSFTSVINHKYNPQTKLVETVPSKTIVVEEKKEEKGKEIIQEISLTAIPVRELNSATLLFAQPISNGYQLIDSEPKVIYKIYKTSDKNVYSAVKGSIQGVLIAKNGGWFFEYYQNDKLVSEEVNVKL
jgi:hypothetical protein